MQDVAIVATQPPAEMTHRFLVLGSTPPLRRSLLKARAFPSLRLIGQRLTVTAHLKKKDLQPL